MLNRFTEKDIPYGKLAFLGIDKEKSLAMPKEVLEPLMNGSITPLIKTQIYSKSGKLYEVPLKMQLIKDKEGNIQLMTYPIRKDLAYDITLQGHERKLLEKGEIIRKEVRENRIRKQQFMQIDKETNSLIRRDVSSLRVSQQVTQMEKINDIQLGTNQKDAIKEGKPVELDVGHEKVTVGVDLKEPQGFKVVKGDLAEWDKQQKIKYDVAHEGFMGYVMTDQNRWEYQQVVDKLQWKASNRNQKQEEKISAGIKR